MRSVAFFTLSLVLTIATACSDSESTTTTSHLVNWCKAHCNYTNECKSGSNDCATKCADTAAIAAFDDLYNPANSDEMTACLNERTPCVGSDDVCVRRGAEKGAGGPVANTQLFKDCKKARQFCLNANKPSFSDDYCHHWPLYSAKGEAEFRKCLQKPCEDRRDCMRALEPPVF